MAAQLQSYRAPLLVKLFYYICGAKEMTDPIFIVFCFVVIDFFLTLSTKGSVSFYGAYWVFAVDM